MSSITKSNAFFAFLSCFLIVNIGFAFTNENQTHSCLRTCESGEPPMSCYYRFDVEVYTTMSKACYDCPLNLTDCFRPQCIAANGLQRQIYVANRQLPGPNIEVCLGDTIIVDVANNALCESTTIHWHGYSQRMSPFMDGVPMVTQCPILPATTFRYKFEAVQPGSYYWHSHSEMQKADGLFGGLIVREANDPQANLYDYDLSEHVILLNDWTSSATEMAFVENHQSNGTDSPSSMLVNGRGRFEKYEDGNGNVVQTPLEVFEVIPGKRYRFRVISSGVMNCPIQMSIDGHWLLIIATDGYPVVPTTVSSFLILSGERYDFVLEANATVGNYWIKCRGLLDCGSNFTSDYQTAVLRYSGAPLEDPPGNVTYENSGQSGEELNALYSSLKSHEEFVMSLNSTVPESLVYFAEPDIQFYLTYDFYYINNPLYNVPLLYSMDEVAPSFRRALPLFNYVAYTPPSSPLLTQLDSIPPHEICNETSLHKNCSTEYCSCTYVLKIPLNALVELVFVDEGRVFFGAVSHPVHLHGQHFRVVAMEKFDHPITKELVKTMLSENKVVRKLHNAVYKDTISVPQAGFAIVHFHAVNPGFWLLHCHMDYHLQTGMALVFQVGDEKDFVPKPKDFPVCGNYLPDY